jgi:LPS export ABC transporter ATP-binding protein
MSVLRAYILQSTELDASALHALRAVLVAADASGRAHRVHLAGIAEDGLQALARLGVVSLADAQGDAATDHWTVVRIVPEAWPSDPQGGTERLRDDTLDAVNTRLVQLEPPPGPAPSLDGDPPADALPEEPGPAQPEPERDGGDEPDVETVAPWERAVAPGDEPLVELPVGADARGGWVAADGTMARPDAEPEARPAVVVEGGTTLGARGLVKVYRKRKVVNEVDIFLRQGEIVGLLGPNGAGKTTTFYMVVGLIKPDRGQVFLGDEDVTAVPMYRRARRGVGYLAQEPSVFRKLTVEENVLAVLQMLGLRRRERRERLEMLLDELGIKHLRHTKAYALSGGERRRLEITRALVGNPKFMLLDEPFAGVDPIAVHDIQQIVSDLRRRGIGVLISDHNVEQTLDIVDRAYIMYDGRVRVSGTVSELVWNDEVAEIYLGPTLTARMRQRYRQPL